MPARPLLDIDELSVEIRRPRHRPVKVIDSVSLSVGEGERVGLVGESGSGKTLLGLSILQLLPDAARVSAGSVNVAGRRVSALGEDALRLLRGRVMAMVFQDPMSGLDPLCRIGTLLGNAARRNGANRSESRRRAVHALAQAGIARPEERLRVYPHQLSGGLRQRVMIALAIINEPSIIVADEPTTALDATIQAQILTLLRSLSAERAVLLITHDLDVAAEVCDRIVVLYAGGIMEEGRTADILGRPAHPYTQGLLSCRPEPTGAPRVRLTPIPGSPPRLGEVPDGCQFAPRCPRAQAKCATRPPLDEYDGRRVACWFPGPADGTAEPVAAPAGEQAGRR